MIVIEASITSKKENNEPFTEAEAKYLIAKENMKKVPTEKKYNESQKVKEQKMKAKIEEIKNKPSENQTKEEKDLLAMNNNKKRRRSEYNKKNYEKMKAKKKNV
eukprot:812547_1